MREETLRDIMTTDVTYSNPQDPVMQAAQKMKQLNVGSIPVCDANQNVIGMITDRDICLRCVADNLPNSTPVQQVMSQNVVTASPDMTWTKPPTSCRIGKFAVCPSWRTEKWSGWSPSATWPPVTRPLKKPVTRSVTFPPPVSRYSNTARFTLLQPPVSCQAVDSCKNVCILSFDCVNLEKNSRHFVEVMRETRNNGMEHNLGGS